MRLCRHPNVLSMHTSFVVETELWIVMPFMAKGESSMPPPTPSLLLPSPPPSLMLAHTQWLSVSSHTTKCTSSHPIQGGLREDCTVDWAPLWAPLSLSYPRAAHYYASGSISRIIKP